MKQCDETHPVKHKCGAYDYGHCHGPETCGEMRRRHIREIEEGDEDMDDGVIRVFESGATRDTSEGKFDYEGFISPIVVERFAEYMHKNRLQSNGTLRDSDNWQKGMGFGVFMKSIWRHFLDVWKLHRGYPCVKVEKGVTITVTIEDALCGLLFNTMGYLHEFLLNKDELDYGRFAKNIKNLNEQLKSSIGGG